MAETLRLLAASRKELACHRRVRLHRRSSLPDAARARVGGARGEPQGPIRPARPSVDRRCRRHGRAAEGLRQGSTGLRLSPCKPRERLARSFGRHAHVPRQPHHYGEFAHACYRVRLQADRAGWFSRGGRNWERRRSRSRVPLRRGQAAARHSMRGCSTRSTGRRLSERASSWCTGQASGISKSLCPM